MSIFITVLKAANTDLSSVRTSSQSLLDDTTIADESTISSHDNSPTWESDWELPRPAADSSSVAETTSMKVAQEVIGAIFQKAVIMTRARDN